VYSVPDVLPADYTPVYAVGQAPLSSKELKSLKRKKYEDWLKSWTIKSPHFMQH
jgi:hypothetical protein